MTLIEKIENQIKELNELKGKYYTKEYIKIQIETLNWVLSELKKMTCENCKYVSVCDKRETWIETNEDIKRIDDITFCSLWEENENINQ